MEEKPPKAKVIELRSKVQKATSTQTFKEYIVDQRMVMDMMVTELHDLSVELYELKCTVKKLLLILREDLNGSKEE